MTYLWVTDFYIVYYLCSSVGPWGAASSCSAFPGGAPATAASLICLIKLGNLVSWGPQVTVSIARPLTAGLKETLTLSSLTCLSQLVFLFAD